ncbi:Gfo/Idh/MocA family oxidoreductase [bacterium]|nr:Gfo/Idh/MocA family oxidoreductase [bacterium]
MTTLGLAIIGAGGANIATSSHLPALRHIPEARLVALHDVNAEGVRRFADEYGAEAYTDLAAMLARDDVEVVVVASPDRFHCEHVVQAAQAGKHILCQKPLALSLDEARRMVAAVTAAGVRFGAAQSFRYEAGARQARQLIAEGAIGQPVYASFSVKGRFYPYPPDSPYRRQDTGGQFLHNGPHYVDLLCCLLDDLPVRVFGQSRAHYPTEDRLETDNYTVCLLDFARGALGRVEQNLTMLDPPGFPQRQETRVMGTEGNLVFGTGQTPALEVFDGSGFSVAQPQTIPPDEEPFVLLQRDFFRAVLEDREPPISMEWSFRVLEACLGTLESCATGEPVALGRIGA